MPLDSFGGREKNYASVSTMESLIKSISYLVKLAEEEKKSFFEVAIEQNIEVTSQSREEILQFFSKIWSSMKESLSRALSPEFRSSALLVKGAGKKYLKSEKSFLSQIVKKAVGYAMAVGEANASMCRIVAFPTGGASGAIPGTLIAYQEETGRKDEDMIEGLVVAASVGAIIGNRATLSGAEGGCQAECGAAAAMAAAALVHLENGSPKMIDHAVAIALKNIMGLICDPVAGLVEVPCIKRNAMAASLAYLSADLALAGVESVIPADEVIDAMGRVGRRLPMEFRETALGGVAATPTAKKISEKLQKEREKFLKDSH